MSKRVHLNFSTGKKKLLKIDNVQRVAEPNAQINLFWSLKKEFGSLHMYETEKSIFFFVSAGFVDFVWTID